MPIPMLNWLKSLFSKNLLIVCPRCLGKGHVDYKDIQRLHKTLIWSPGECAYCAGLGKVPSTLPLKVAVDEAYLTVELSAEDRKALIDGQLNAMYKRKLFNENFNLFIGKINDIYFIDQLNEEQIADKYLASQTFPDAESYAERKREMADYIRKVVRISQR